MKKSVVLLIVFSLVAVFARSSTAALAKKNDRRRSHAQSILPPDRHRHHPAFLPANLGRFGRGWDCRR